ncbi:MAG: pyridoxamine 5'-phosphate oxidase family protein [Sphingomonadaceae bacterium]|nr:pyridoxamine 5'-phosphate oxidase family protein [Sphingomonadaceae bacterium]
MFGKKKIETLHDLTERMSDIDIAILSTRAENGAIAGRPMSNNGDVEYDGDSYYFALENTNTVKDIQRDPQVGLGFQGKHWFYVAVEGRADLIRDKAQFDAHWVKDLELWFKDGVDTPGLVLIHVKADRIHWWDKGDEGDIRP